MSCHYKSGRRSLFVITCLWLLLSIRWAQAGGPAFQIQYEAENDYLSAGTASWSLTQQDSGWVLQLTTSPSRLVRLAGVGKIVETAVLHAPEPPFKAIAYSYKDSKRKKKNYSAALAKDTDEIVITRADQSIVIPAGDTGVIDRLSATLAVSTELTRNPEFNSLQFKVLDRNGVRDMVFHNIGVETIRLGKQTYVSHLIESSRPGSSRKTRTWFAPVGNTEDRQRLLPVKIEQYKKDSLVLRMSLSNYILN
jgi:hypothetical protein